MNTGPADTTKEMTSNAGPAVKDDTASAVPSAPPPYEPAHCTCEPTCMECGHVKSAHDDQHRCRLCEQAGMRESCLDPETGEAPEYLMPGITWVIEREATWWEPAEYLEVCSECGLER